MYDRSIIDIVDAAIDRRRLCSGCGAPNVVRTERDFVYVVCSSERSTRRDVLGRLAARLFPHDRILVLP